MMEAAGAMRAVALAAAGGGGGAVAGVVAPRLDHLHHAVAL